MNSFIELDRLVSPSIFMICGVGEEGRKHKCLVYKRRKSLKLSAIGQQDEYSTELWLSVSSRSLFTNYGLARSTIPQRRYNEDWSEHHKKHIQIVGKSNAEVVLLGDSLVFGLNRYKKLWTENFTPLNTLNLALKGDRTQNTLWRLQETKLPPTTRVVVVLVGTNNCNFDTPKEIAEGIASIAAIALELRPGIKIILCGLLPREIKKTPRRYACMEVNVHLRKFVLSGNLRGLMFLEPDDDLTFSNGRLNLKYFYEDFVHLNFFGYEKLSKAIVTAILKALSGKKKRKSGRYLWHNFLVFNFIYV